MIKTAVLPRDQSERFVPRHRALAAFANESDQRISKEENVIAHSPLRFVAIFAFQGLVDLLMAYGGAVRRQVIRL